MCLVLNSQSREHSAYRITQNPAHHTLLCLYCEETAMKCVVRGTEESMAISNLLKAPKPLPIGLTKCAHFPSTTKVSQASIS